MFKVLSPLEQFEVHILFLFRFFDLFDISVSSLTVYSFIVIFFIYGFFYSSLYTSCLVPTFWQSSIEVVYRFVFNMLKQQAGLRAQFMFPLFFVTFMFVLFSNLIGLTPFGVTVTAYIVITFTLALSFNLSFFFFGIMYHQFAFFNLFVPSDAPKVLVPLIVSIEIISYLLRTFSLSLRLFANMMAGHTLLHLLASFLVKFWQSSHYFVAFFPFILIFAVLVLELGIAMLQAYVFVLLLCIYLNDALHPGH